MKIEMHLEYCGFISSNITAAEIDDAEQSNPLNAFTD